MKLPTRKNKVPKIPRFITELIPISDYDDLNQCFLFRDGRLFDIMQLECKNLYTMSSDEKQMDMLHYSKLYKTYGDDIKIVGINYPTDTTLQQAYLRHKLEVTDNPVFKKRLKDKLNEMELISEKSFDREYFLFVFAEDEKALRDNRNILTATLSTLGNPLIREISKEKKIRLLAKINNKSTAFYSLPNAAPRGKEELKKIISKKGYNPYLLYQIQPQGGLNFGSDPTIVTAGDGFEACLHIWKYPKDVDDHWLSQILNVQNVITTIDISTQDVETAKKNLNKGMQEQDIRFSTASNNAEQIDARVQYQRLQSLYNQVSNMGEMLKLIHVRLYISGRTREDVENQIKVLQTMLEGNDYRAAVFLNETENEWAAMYRSYTDQMKAPIKRIGQPVSSEALAGGYPFHFTSLSDPNGIYIGRTTTVGAKGNIFFNLFESDSKYRLSYSCAVSGATGSGKSTLLKKVLENNAICGNFIRGFDAVGDFTDLIHYLGGKIVSLDGTDGVLNALEIFHTAENDTLSYSRHISKMSTILKFLAPDIGMYESLEFTRCLDELYSKWHLNPGEKDVMPQITGLDPAKYPTFSDLLALIQRKCESIQDLERDRDELIRLKHLELIISDLVKNYGHIFDGHTSIPDIFDTQIVYFNIKNLAQMKPEIFDCQVFNAITLSWDNCVKLGEKMKRMYEDKEIAWEDVTRFLLILDEAHKIVNANKMQAVELLVVFAREARKFFGGIMLASQSIRDYVPENTSSAALDQLKILFELMQYKVIMRQDSNSLPVLRTIFQGQFTDTELSRIPTFDRGVCLLSISSYKNIEFKVDVSGEELARYRGGV